MPPIKSGETITTAEPKIDITPTKEVPLPVGTHIFELVVEDDQGRKSPPVRVNVVVQKTLPDAAIKGPDKVEVASRFALDGAGSAAVAPSKLTKYHWRLVPATEAPINSGGTSTPVRPS
jgi:hypothetical protein